MSKQFFSLSRPDGRPECYDVPPVPVGMGYKCAVCIHETGDSPKYPAREAFMCNPVDAKDTQSHFVCKRHLPDNIVIFDPLANMCRDKTGQNTWREGEVEGDPLIRQLFDSQTIPAGVMNELQKKSVT